LIALVLAGSVAHAAGANEVTAEQAQKWVALFDKLVDSVVTDRNDCEHMAAHITGLAVANQDTIAMAREARAQGKHLPAAAQQHMLDSLQRMVGALDKCGHDDKVAEAFHRLDLGGR
jgi:aromatic ring-opening dioxygenase catalytic subunit (LigB family)